jgi:hypothetical protein
VCFEQAETKDSPVRGSDAGAILSPRGGSSPYLFCGIPGGSARASLHRPATFCRPSGPRGRRITRVLEGLRKHYLDGLLPQRFCLHTAGAFRYMRGRPRNVIPDGACGGRSECGGESRTWTTTLWWRPLLCVYPEFAVAHSGLLWENRAAVRQTDANSPLNKYILSAVRSIDTSAWFRSPNIYEAAPKATGGAVAGVRCPPFRVSEGIAC